MQLFSKKYQMYFVYYTPNIFDSIVLYNAKGMMMMEMKIFIFI